MAVCGTIYSSFAAFRQLDVKRVIAYASIAHMNLGVLGLFSFNALGLFGFLLFMVGHGLISSSLFYIVGILYERYHTRCLYYYGGLVSVMPLTAFFFFVFTFANAGFPGSINFIAEFCILLSISQINVQLLLLVAPSIIMSLVYGLWLFSKIMFGNLNRRFIKIFYDLSLDDFYILSV
jgi:NADH:ubiquinone oxidoreductase subunit 4 (subunit M)